VPPGTYDITTEAAGFNSQARKNFLLEVAQQAQIDFTLEVGDASQVVTVNGGTDLLQTTDASVSTLVDRELTDNIPLNGRSFQNLITLAPAVNLSNAQNSNGQFVVNGLRASANSFSVDGVNAVSTVTGYQSAGGNNASYNAAGGTNSMVAADALQEFRILTSSYAPEYGRTPGAQVLLSTRSGTNIFHGAAFEYIRNDKLNAADWFVDQAGQSKPPLRSNDFGGVFGGPVVRNKTFFFVSYERSTSAATAIRRDHGPVPGSSPDGAGGRAAFPQRLPCPERPRSRKQPGTVFIGVLESADHELHPYQIRPDFLLQTQSLRHIHLCSVRQHESIEQRHG
jgi:hypothetical protein